MTQNTRPDLNRPEEPIPDRLTQTELRRSAFKESGLSYSDIERVNIDRLIELVSIQGGSHSRMKMSVERVLKKDVALNRNGSIKYAYIKVKGPYFNKREAISFNEDGFIGFAGWADKHNVQPFVKAFDLWLKELIAAGYCQLRKEGGEDE